MKMMHARMLDLLSNYPITNQLIFMSTHVQTKVVLVHFQILMNVQQILIIAMSMPVAATQRVLSSAPAILVTLETGLYVKVILNCSFNVCLSHSLCIVCICPGVRSIAFSKGCAMKTMEVVEERGCKVCRLNALILWCLITIRRPFKSYHLSSTLSYAVLTK